MSSKSSTHNPSSKSFTESSDLHLRDIPNAEHVLKRAAQPGAHHSAAITHLCIISIPDSVLPSMSTSSSSSLSSPSPPSSVSAGGSDDTDPACPHWYSPSQLRTLADLISNPTLLTHLGTLECSLYDLCTLGDAICKRPSLQHLILYDSGRDGLPPPPPDDDDDEGEEEEEGEDRKVRLTKEDRRRVLEDLAVDAPWLVNAPQSLSYVTPWLSHLQQVVTRSTRQHPQLVSPIVDALANPAISALPTSIASVIGAYNAYDRALRRLTLVSSSDRYYRLSLVLIMNWYPKKDDLLLHTVEQGGGTSNPKQQHVLNLIQSTWNLQHTADTMEQQHAQHTPALFLPSDTEPVSLSPCPHRYHALASSPVSDWSQYPRLVLYCSLSELATCARIGSSLHTGIAWQASMRADYVQGYTMQEYAPTTATPPAPNPASAALDQPEQEPDTNQLTKIPKYLEGNTWTQRWETDDTEPWKKVYQQLLQIMGPIPTCKLQLVARNWPKIH